VDEISCWGPPHSQTILAQLAPQTDCPRHVDLGFAALACIPLATVLIEPRGICFLNAAAEKLLSCDDGLHRRSMYGLGADLREETRQLGQLIQDALDGVAGRTISISRRRSALPLLISVSPLSDPRLTAPLGISSFALLLIHDPLGGCATIARETLADLYGLTDAETTVAIAIVEGKNAKRIASTRGVSVPTVRSQIRQILAKTGCCDQRMLISRFGRLGLSI
jgi:DNA-binding CsgD family transcriptional regulator